jgi:hypothetical protein
MQSVGYPRLRQAVIVLGLLWLSLGAFAMPAAADLFSTHRVTVQLATKDGNPMADAEVRVFGPGGAAKPALTGRTDSAGKFEFEADRDGFWSAEARNGDEVARVSIRVGEETVPSQPISPYWLYAGLGLLLVMAFCYRLLRIRLRRRIGGVDGRRPGSRRGLRPPKK